jgi:anti-anti-sigma factor
MQCSSEIVEGVRVVGTPCAQLDMLTGADLIPQFKSTLEDGLNVVLDLDGVDFIDSAGFGALLHCRNYAKNQGATLRLCAMAPNVRKIFTIMHLDQLFPLYGSREEAVRSFSQQQAT